MTRTTINEKVNVTAVYFQNKHLKTFPRRIELNGHTYTFNDGLQYLIKKGSDTLQIFDMTDGTADYRLTYNQHNWTLVTITPHA